jgi:hypothetical protein
LTVLDNPLLSYSLPLPVNELSHSYILKGRIINPLIPEEVLDLVKTEKSKEKKILIKGKVNGEPMHTRYGGTSLPRDEVRFSIALTDDVVAKFKKPEPSMIPAGSNLVVSCTDPIYIRNGDYVELLGRIFKIILNNGVVCHLVETEYLFNASLPFSFDY